MDFSFTDGLNGNELNFAFHVQDVKTFFFDTNDHADFVRSEIDEIFQLILTGRIDARRRFFAHLKIRRSHRHFVFGSIGKNDRFASFDPDDHSRFAFESSAQHFNVISHGEELSQFVRLERNFVFQRFVFRQDPNRIAVDADDCALKIDQFSFTHFDQITRSERKNIVSRPFRLVDRN